MIRGYSRVAFVSGLTLLAGILCSCALEFGKVVLLPQQDGHNAAVSVQHGDKTVTLEQPYAAAQQTSSGLRAYASNAQEVDAVFGAALAARPVHPQSFTLYFIEGSDEF